MALFYLRSFGGGGLSVRIASIDDLITMKTGTGRSQDEADTDALRRLKAYLAHE